MDIITYALSKKIAAHALSGVQSMSVSGQTLTINTKDSGVLTMTFPTPKDGVSVTDIDVNANNQIVFTMSDGSEIISGKIPTLKGDAGFSPTITENADNTDKIYKLDITTADSTFTTPNLKGADGTGGEGASTWSKISDKPFESLSTDFSVENGELKVVGGTGEENTIESISVNGTPISVDENKNVDIAVPSIDGLTKDADLATVAKSGSYEDLSNKPTIPDITGLATETYVDNKVADYTKTADLADVATSGSYNDLADKPTIPSLDGYAKTSEIPSKVSELENDSNYLSSIPEEYVTETELSAKGYLTEHQDISGKVDKVEGKSLISDTEIARLATVDNYDDTDIKAEIAKKADTTAIPSKVSELTNDSNYQTAEQVNSTVTTEIAKVVADAPEDFDTLKEMSDWIAGHENDASAMNSAISDNKTAITALQTGKADKSEIPTTVAQLTDSADYAKTSDVNASISALQTDKANTSDLTAHTGDSVIHVTAENKTLWNTVSNKVNKEDGKALLADTDKTNYDDAVTKAHTHENKEVLDGITSDKVTAWDNKSDFSGSYNDLNDKPTIDAELSNTSENAIQNKVVTKEINKLYSDISFNDHDTATSGTSFTDAEDGNMIVTDWTKNLLNPTLETTEQNGVTCTNNGDGTYTFNGTISDQGHYFRVFSSTDINMFKGLRLIGYPKKQLEDVFNSNISLTFRDSNSEIIKENADKGDGSDIISEAPEGTESIEIGIWLGHIGEIINNVVFKPMLTADLTATYDDFVPYGGYEIQSCGKNLMQVNDATNGAILDTKTNFDLLVQGLDKVDTQQPRFYFEKHKIMGGHNSFTFEVTKDELYGLRIKHNGSTKDIIIEDINYMVRKGTYTISFDTASNNPSVECGLLLHNIQLEHGDTETDFEPYTGETITVTNTTEAPAFGLKSHKGITNIISPGNVKCVYPTNESGKGVLDSLYNKDKMLTEQNENLDEQGLLNKFDGQYKQGAYSTNDGTWIDLGSAISNTNKIYCKSGDIIDLKYSSSIKYLFIEFFNGNDEFISSKIVDNASALRETAPENTSYIRFGIQVEDGALISPDTAGKTIVYVNNAIDEIKKDLGGLTFSASGTTLTITDGTNTWTLGANS